MEAKNAKKIRKIWFSKEYQIDSNLLDILDTNDREFDFLKNPVVQNIHNYQIDYLYNFSKQWFNDSPVSILD